MKVYQVAGTLLATAVACFQRLTIAMSNIRTITSQGNLILTPLYPLLFPMTISAIATMEIKEAGCFFKEGESSSLQYASVECCGGVEAVSRPRPLQAI